MSDSTLRETLFASSTVRLFGRKFEGLRLVTEEESAAGGAEGAAAQSQTPMGAPPVLRALQQQFQSRGMRADAAPGLARIYGFSYLGSYYKLAEPTVLLVYGDGKAIPPTVDPTALGLVGVEFKDETFAQEVFMWVQDCVDYSVRIDITPGWLTDILVEPGMADGTNMTAGRSQDNSASGPLVGRNQLVGRGHLVGRGTSG